VKRGHRGRFGSLLVTAAIVAGTAGLSGCAAPRNTLGTNSSPCFRALALAEDAVHDRGAFAGVRLVAYSTIAKQHPRLKAALAARSSTRLHNVCLVSYRGTFRPSQVSRPAGTAPPSGVGHFAIVVVSTPQNQLLATFVLEKEPVRFRHLASGPPVGAGNAGLGSVVGGERTL
jgi:hypothetical protein